MATKFNHVQLNVVENSSDINVLYPQNTATDVTIDKTGNKRIPANINKLQDLVNNIGEMAFVDKDKMVFLAESEEYSGELVNSEIDDSITSISSTWSSSKMCDTLTEYINNQSTVEENILRLHLSPKVYIVNNSLLPNVKVPESGEFVWLVEYFPINITISSTSTKIGRAYQRWTKMDISDHKQYYRFIYIPGGVSPGEISDKWGSFGSF